jgi:hypothetical protein
MQSYKPNSDKKLQNQPQHYLRKVPIEFYISFVSISALFILLVSDVLQKKERIEFAKMGYIQKFENNKLIWTKP